MNYENELRNWVLPWKPISQLSFQASRAGAGDERFEYNEMRMIALAPKTEILYCVAFVDRGKVRRIISLRRANRREVKHYVQSL